MSNLSFSNATRINVGNINRGVYTPPYDGQATFNRVIHTYGNNPQDNVYSIDTVKFLRALNQDRLNKLLNITLITRPDQYGDTAAAMWDVIFNTAKSLGLNACIFLADKDYRPITTHRVVVAAQYLNYSLPITRLHLNKIRVGDMIGIGMVDISSNTQYILLYRIDEECFVSKSLTSGSITMSAINCQLHHAVTIDTLAAASCVNVDDFVYDSETMGPFVEHISNVLDDMPSAFPWKPHFLPVVPDKFDVSSIIEHLKTVDVVEAAYVDFENTCRAAYQAAKMQHMMRPKDPEAAGDRRKSRNKTKAPAHVMYKLPIVHVYKDATYLIALIDIDFNDNYKGFKIPLSDIPNEGISETYLVGADLVDIDITNIPSVVALDSETWFRYLSVNF